MCSNKFIELYDILCGKNKYRCKNHKCINIENVCDDIDDCGDNSDELDCKSKIINKLDSLRIHKCDNKVIYEDRICDGVFDCKDRSDESGCMS